jgi:hypothetical protein
MLAALEFFLGAAAEEVEGEIEGGKSAGDVVLEIGVEAFVAQVEVWGYGEEQDIRVEAGKVKGLAEPLEAGRRWGGLVMEKEGLTDGSLEEAIDFGPVDVEAAMGIGGGVRAVMF